MTKPAKQGFATRAIHSAYDPLDYKGALNPPVFMTATYAFDRSDRGSAIFAGEEEGFIYSRVGNPTVDVLERRVADLEGGEAALATASGMGAVTAALWTLLASGDEVVADKTLYGCTFGLLEHHMPRFGVKVRFADLAKPGVAAEAVTAGTRLVLTETPSNPDMRLVDLAALAEACRKAGALLLVDNTYCSPYLQNPLALGADLVLHSATKYLGGHGDLIGGLVVGSKALVDRLRFEGVKELNGACMSAMDAFLILRGLKTLALRMDRHCDNASALAEEIARHPAVERLHYPGLASHPQHELAKRQMRGMGGMMALELKGGLPAGRRFMDALRIATRAVSLGDAETLVQHPASMTHSNYSPEERARHGVADGLIRISVGLEDLDDLRADFRAALEEAG